MYKKTNTQLNFYQDKQLHTALYGIFRHTFFRNQDRPLAEQHSIGPGTAHLLATDTQGSILQAQDAQGTHPLSYTAFGHNPDRKALSLLTGFNGETRDRQTGWYLLGNGYRAFSPVLMRFISPDSYSPFGKGGTNTYMYCAGDPVNYIDPTGHMYRPRFNQPVRNRGVSPAPLDLSQRPPTALGNRQNPISRNGRPRQAAAGPDVPVASTMASGASRPSASPAIPAVANNDVPLDLRNQVAWRINDGQHEKSHPQNKEFIAIAAAELVELSKTQQPREARNKFISGLSVVLPQGTYKSIINQASAIRRKNP